MKWYQLLIGLLVVSVLAGCGSGGIDENKPIDQVAAEAAEMSQVELQKMVDKYEAVIADKAKEIDALKAKIKEIPFQDLMGEEAKALKDKATELSDSLSKLKDQMTAYAKELTAQE